MNKYLKELAKEANLCEMQQVRTYKGGGILFQNKTLYELNELMRIFEANNLNPSFDLERLFTIYKGQFSTPDDGKGIKIGIGQAIIEFDLASIINVRNRVLLDMSEQELQKITHLTRTKVQLLTQGVHVKRLNPEKYAPNTCYFGYVADLSGVKY
jgi:hypothetical protein